MYTLLLIVLIGIAVLLFMIGLRQKSKAKISLAVIFALGVLGFYWFMGFWVEKLWFDAVGYSERFWTVFSTKFLFALIGGGGCFLIVWLLTIFLPRKKRFTRLTGAGIAALIGVSTGYNQWETILRFWHRESAGVADPLFGLDAGFYLFTLPFIRQAFALLMLSAVIATIISIITIFIGFQTYNNKIVFHPAVYDETTKRRMLRSFLLSVSSILILLALGKWLGRYELMYSNWGPTAGASWTDVNIRLPMFYVAIAVAAVAMILLWIPKVHDRIQNRMKFPFSYVTLFTTGTIVGSMLILWLLLLTVAPAVFQWLRVEPNEITFERPYITNNIEYTQIGFNLHTAEEREFPANERIQPLVVDQNPVVFDNIRLWDWRVLDDVYRQFQEFRLYYEFQDVDLDRYKIDGRLRQVMVSAREMETANLPPNSQTFVNQRFKYTHGYGITLTTVSEFTSNGLPNLLIKDIPPKTAHPELEVKEPRIYYGELTDEHVIVNSNEEEFDYPRGEENVYNRYNGTGGVQLSGFWRKFLFGWKFDGTRLLFSSYPNNDSRIMYHREIKERVNKLAPFLEFDEDPYITLADGKLYWIIDGYTTSNNFPYSQPFDGREVITTTEGNLQSSQHTHLRGINYIRNSVKAVVDAYNGTVDFYIFDEQDPIIKVYDNIFPGLFKPREAMPSSLLQHVRYPEDYLLIQGLVYAKYHMNDPEVFYNQEDLWIRATEKYFGDVQPVEPYYIMWELPDSDKPEFALILPFTPKNRQVMIGWIAGLSNPENYGRFITYKFPKDKRVLGPQQVETKIDQDSYLSAQLALWDQRGSNVIRGNVLAIPVENTILYVEPIYLEAETAAYPELRLVVVMHEDVLAYAETFDAALQELFRKKGFETGDTDETEADEANQADHPLEEEDLGEETDDSPFPAVYQDQLVKQANEAFQDYLEQTGSQNYEEAARSLRRLEQYLEQMMEAQEE